MTAAQACAPVTADGIDFIDENDAGRVLFGLLKHVADAGCANAHEHFDEIGARNREKGHFGLARNGARQEGLAGARRAHHQHTFRDLAAKFLELAGIFQEIDDFDDFLLCFLNPRHVGEGDIDLILP